MADEPVGQVLALTHELRPGDDPDQPGVPGDGPGRLDRPCPTRLIRVVGDDHVPVFEGRGILRLPRRSSGGGGDGVEAAGQSTERVRLALAQPDFFVSAPFAWRREEAAGAKALAPGDDLVLVGRARSVEPDIDQLAPIVADRDGHPPLGPAVTALPPEAQAEAVNDLRRPTTLLLETGQPVRRQGLQGLVFALGDDPVLGRGLGLPGLLTAFLAALGRFPASRFNFDVVFLAKGPQGSSVVQAVDLGVKGDQVAPGAAGEAVEHVGKIVVGEGRMLFPVTGQGAEAVELSLGLVLAGDVDQAPGDLDQPGFGKMLRGKAHQAAPLAMRGSRLNSGASLGELRAGLAVAGLILPTG